MQSGACKTQRGEARGRGPVDHPLGGARGLPREIWTAVTEPALLRDWLDGEVELEIRPGGRGTIVEPDGAVRLAEVEELTPGRRLAFRWWPEDGNGPASVVEIELDEAVGTTRLTVTETVVDDGRAGSPTANTLEARWSARLVLLGCCLLSVPVACR